MFFSRRLLLGASEPVPEGEQQVVEAVPKKMTPKRKHFMFFCAHLMYFCWPQLLNGHCLSYVSPRTCLMTLCMAAMTKLRL
jgi:hypothetical protein